MLAQTLFNVNGSDLLREVFEMTFHYLDDLECPQCCPLESIQNVMHPQGTTEAPLAIFNRHKIDAASGCFHGFKRFT